MIDHVSVGVRDLDYAAAFYESVLSPLGLARLVTRETSVGFGRRYPEFWLNLRPAAAPRDGRQGEHVCLRAPDHGAVDAFHRAALAAGGRDAGAPGRRRGTVTTYYGAFVLDLDGHRIEALALPGGEASGPGM